MAQVMRAGEADVADSSGMLGCERGSGSVR